MATLPTLTANTIITIPSQYWIVTCLTKSSIAFYGYMLVPINSGKIPIIPGLEKGP